MTVYYELKPGDKLTEEQIERLKALAEREPVYDEDNPPLTEEQLALVRKLAKEKREQRNKQNVTIRLSPAALQKARSLGKGYTSVLSRILEEALNDNEVIARNL